MKRFIVTCAWLVTTGALLAGQMPKYGVKVEAEKNVDFAKFKTYTWTQGQPSPDKRVDAQIMAAVDRELGALGMTKAASGTGDVLAAYYSLTRTDVDVKAKADDKGLRPQYSVGTLAVALLEPSSRRRLVRMRIDKPISTEAAKVEETINSAVADLFAKYPTRTKK